MMKIVMVDGSTCAANWVQWSIYYLTFFILEMSVFNALLLIFEGIIKGAKYSIFKNIEKKLVRIVKHVIEDENYE